MTPGVLNSAATHRRRQATGTDHSFHFLELSPSAALRPRERALVFFGYRVKQTNTLGLLAVSRGTQCLLPSSRERLRIRRCLSRRVWPG